MLPQVGDLGLLSIRYAKPIGVQPGPSTGSRSLTDLVIPNQSILDHGADYQTLTNQLTQSWSTEDAGDQSPERVPRLCATVNLDEPALLKAAQPQHG